MATADITAPRLSGSEHRAHLRRAMIASTVGTTVEWYEAAPVLDRNHPPGVLRASRDESARSSQKPRIFNRHRADTGKPQHQGGLDQDRVAGRNGKSAAAASSGRRRR
jgi:hypothetical protein